MYESLSHTLFKSIMHRDFENNDKDTLTAVMYLFKSTGLEASLDLGFYLNDGKIASDYINNHFDQWLENRNTSYLGLLAESCVASLERLADKHGSYSMSREDWVNLCAITRYELKSYRASMTPWQKQKALDSICSCEAFKW